MKQETYPVALYTTKTAMWQHLEPAVRVLNNQSAEPTPLATTLGDVIRKYRELKLPELAASTRNTQNGQIQIHIEPRWGDRTLTEIHPGEVQQWISSVKLSQVSRSHVMVLMRTLPLRIAPRALWRDPFFDCFTPHAFFNKFLDESCKQ
jgi:hypothetical protein